jgi:hypothetical protein
MSQRGISRRTLLRGLGVSIALPWLEAMNGPANWLQAATAPRSGGPFGSLGTPGNRGPKRLAFFYVPNGIHMPEWTPERDGSQFDLPPILKEFSAFQNQMNVISGLTLNGARALGDGAGDHARSVAAFLTGAHPKKTNGADIAAGISVDQLAAARIGQATRLASLELGTETSAQAGNCDSGYSCAYTSNLSWRTPTSPVAKEMDPAAVFDRLFANTDHTMTAEQRALRQKRRQSILDSALADAKSLHGQLGQQDRRKLDEYLHAVRELEQRVERTEKLDQRDPQNDDFTRPTGVPRSYGDHVGLLLDMLVLAFQTDSTRIATFMFANAGSNRSYREIGVAEGHHDVSHHGNSPEKQKRISEINHFHAQLMSRFLERLATTPEGDGNLLDNSLIVYGSGISDGNAHNHDNLPIVLFGSGGGAISTNRHLRYPKETPLTNLYVTLLNHMGIAEKSFGDSTGMLENL